jgi:hypothetical protein
LPFCTRATSETIVDLAVAVVIETVADFCFGSGLSDTRSPLATGAGLFAGFAGPDAAATGLGGSVCAGATFVWLAVAVGIFVTASIDCCG